MTIRCLIVGGEAIWVVPEFPSVMTPSRSVDRQHALITAAFVVAIVPSLVGVAVAWAAATDGATVSGTFEEGSDDRYLLWPEAGQK